MSIVGGEMLSVISACRPLRFRGKYRMMNWLAPKQGVQTCNVFGSRMKLDLSDWIQRNIFLGSYEQPQTSRVLAYLKPGMTFVDVGANIGYYTAMAASKVGAGRVIAYEPNPYSFDRLTEWIQMNRIANVEAVCVALGATGGSLVTHFYEGDNHTASLVPEAPEGASKTVVDVRSLDAEAERLSLQQIDVMKIDVDGYEWQVFSGCERLFREKKIRAILCEFNEHWLNQVGSSAPALERFLSEQGFMKQKTWGPPELNDRWFVYKNN